MDHQESRIAHILEYQIAYVARGGEFRALLPRRKLEEERTLRDSIPLTHSKNVHR